ncbi:hypothetical protein H113_00083 [Trichophyton rubrum MR1459]|uniref:Uncharacterized protein n=1 Tax=Trichophyton rubrum (strain ATCC MYA-4607 / CBS 118892) TaxID=559305 RepID=A0A080WYL6_TRIRC|nr:uncharacterized protein TERG_12704 [Trichophyton rubrum CBS 118892]EZG00398.1 hypothetical protein H113_00083 [Trichophyton rubrum MR1459]KFL63083.1 hypothetical protein TERG_12704 [Trichophyton rubrum CBS 118892]
MGVDMAVKDSVLGTVEERGDTPRISSLQFSSSISPSRLVSSTAALNTVVSSLSADFCLLFCSRRLSTAPPSDSAAASRLTDRCSSSIFLSCTSSLKGTARLYLATARKTTLPGRRPLDVGLLAVRNSKSWISRTVPGVRSSLLLETRTCSSLLSRACMVYSPSLRNSLYALYTASCLSLLWASSSFRTITSITRSTRSSSLGGGHCVRMSSAIHGLI